jgi:DNA-binding response OmpR family regulator
MSLPLAPEDASFRVLLLTADDNLGRQLYFLLEKAGFAVRRVTEAIMGQAIWEGFQPHLVLADTRPLGLDGLAVCRRARDDQSFVPIVLFGPAEEAQEIAALKAGADDYIAEPFRLPAIMARTVAQLRRAYRYNPQPVTVPAEGEDEVDEMQPFWEDEPSLATSAGASKTAPANDVLPPGWAECDLCGFRARRQEFEKEDFTGKIRLVCPSCGESEHVVYSLN